MKVFCYFIEPASYSVDLAKQIYEKNNIDYCFIYSTSLVKSATKSNEVFLQNKSLLDKLAFVLEVFRKYDFIIVNGYNNYVFIITFLLNFFCLKKRYVATESDTQLITPKNPIIGIVKWLYLSIIFRNKYVLGFAGGNYTHKQLFRNYGMDEERIFLMPMMVDNAKFYHMQKEFPTTFTFLYVGRLVAHKNVEALIKQFNHHFTDKDAILKIVGTGKEEEDLKRHFSSDKVIFLGKMFDEELINEFQNASCFVCPSIFEPWGLVVNEAMSSGLAVIASKQVGATFDLIEKKETGYVANNMKEFGEKMLVLYNNKEKLVRFSANAIKLMEEYWNYNLYNNCLSNSIKKVEEWG
ncbi:MAG: glycosyltransferase family 4 protein [Bacteroidota bacterium]|nr:glycosyltransferase family 4 protein [Bacteroidota bacterium]